MSFRSIGRKITHACPGIYLAGAKLGKPVFWTKKILGIECNAGKKIARLYWKYGNAVLEKTPEISRGIYRRAAKYVPCKWKAKLMEREDQAFEKCALLAADHL